MSQDGRTPGGDEMSQFWAKKPQLPGLGSAAKAPPQMEDSIPPTDTSSSEWHSCSSGSSSVGSFVGDVKKEEAARSFTFSDGVPSLSSSALVGAMVAEQEAEPALFADWGGELKKLKFEIKQLGGNRKALYLALEYFWVRMQEAEVAFRKKIYERQMEERAKHIAIAESNLKLRETNERLRQEILEHKRSLAAAQEKLEKERKREQEIELLKKRSSDAIEVLERQKAEILEERESEREEMHRAQQKLSSLSAEVNQLKAQLSQAKKTAQAEKDRAQEEIMNVSAQLKRQTELARSRELERNHAQQQTSYAMEKEKKLRSNLDEVRAAKVNADKTIASLREELQREKAERKREKEEWKWANFDDEDSDYGDDNRGFVSYAGPDLSRLPKPFAEPPSPSTAYSYRQAPPGSSTAPSRLEPDPNRSMKTVSSGEQVYYKGKWWYCRKNGSSCYIYRTKADFNNRNHYGAPATTSVTPSRRR